MAGKYDVNKAMELPFDDEFGLSDNEIIEEESKDAYCYCVKDCWTTKLLENLVGKLVSDTYGFSLDKLENKVKEQLH